MIFKTKRPPGTLRALDVLIIFAEKSANISLKKSYYSTTPHRERAPATLKIINFSSFVIVLHFNLQLILKIL